MSGCAPAGQALVVATSWPEAETRPIADAFARRPGDPVAITWVRLARGVGPEQVISHRAPVDVILGGSASVYQTLADAGKLDGADGGGLWRIARRSAPGRSYPGDPRSSTVALARVKAGFTASDWPAEYADFAFPTLRLSHDKPGGGFDEGAAVVRGARNPEAARAFLGLFDDPEPAHPRDDPPESGQLLADLLGAAFIDAREEQVAAMIAVGRAGHPLRWMEWMTQAPPWPPASITRLVERHKSPGATPESLANEIVTDGPAREWLLKSWAKSPRPIDGDTLDELARAADGKLAREPRFRAWLRGEWREWARQRYRRVARGAGKGWP